MAAKSVIKLFNYLAIKEDHLHLGHLLLLAKVLKLGHRITSLNFLRPTEKGLHLFNNYKIPTEKSNLIQY